MRYPYLCGCILLALFVAASPFLHAQKEDPWEGTYANGLTLSPLRSLERTSDSLLALVFRTKEKKLGGDSSLVHTYYQPVVISVDSLLELRKVKPNYSARGGSIGMAAGILLSIFIDQDNLSNRNSDIGTVWAGMLLGGMIGLAAESAIGADEVYSFDPLTKEERRWLVRNKLERAAPDDLNVRTIDSGIVPEKPAGQIWIAVGAGPGRWPAMIGAEEGHTVPRVSFGLEHNGLLFGGAWMRSSTEWYDMVTVDLLLGAQITWKRGGIALSAGPSFISATFDSETGFLPKPVLYGIDPEASVGLAAVLDMTVPLTDYLGVSGAAYGNISPHGPMLGLALSAKLGTLR